MTLAEGRQLPLTHVPYILNEAYILNALNAPLSRVWLTCMFRPPQLVAEIESCEPISIMSDGWKWENLECSLSEKTASKSAIYSQSKASLQSAAIQSKHNHLNLGAPQFLELYACNYHSPAHCKMASHHAFIPLEHISFQSQQLIDVTIVAVQLKMNM